MLCTFQYANLFERLMLLGTLKRTQFPIPGVSIKEQGMY